MEMGFKVSNEIFCGRERNPPSMLQRRYDLGGGIVMV